MCRWSVFRRAMSVKADRGMSGGYLSTAGTGRPENDVRPSPPVAAEGRGRGRMITVGHGHGHGHDDDQDHVDHHRSLRLSARLDLGKACFPESGCPSAPLVAGFWGTSQENPARPGFGAGDHYSRTATTSALFRNGWATVTMVHTHVLNRGAGGEVPPPLRARRTGASSYRIIRQVRHVYPTGMAPAFLDELLVNTAKSHAPFD